MCHFAACPWLAGNDGGRLLSPVAAKDARLPEITGLGGATLSAMVRAPRFFLSHSMLDASEVEKLHSTIVGLGVNVYLAENDPQPGVNLAGKVLAEIKASDAVIGAARRGRRLLAVGAAGDRRGAGCGEARRSDRPGWRRR